MAVKCGVFLARMQPVHNAHSSTKIRQAFIDNNIDYIKEYCPDSVVKRFDYLASYYKDVFLKPKDDFSLE